MGKRNFGNIVAGVAVLALAAVALVIIQRSTSLVTAFVILLATTATAGILSFPSLRPNRNDSHTGTEGLADAAVDPEELRHRSPQRPTKVMLTPESVEEIGQLAPHVQSNILGVIEELREHVDATDPDEGDVGRGILWRRGITRAARERQATAGNGPDYGDSESPDLVVIYTVRPGGDKGSGSSEIYVLRVMDALFQARFVAAVRGREEVVRSEASSNIDDEIRSIFAELGIG